MNQLSRIAILMALALTCSIYVFSQENVSTNDTREQIASKLKEKFADVLYTDSLFCVQQNGVWEFADENGKIFTKLRLTNVWKGFSWATGDLITGNIQGKEYTFSNAFHDGKILAGRYNRYFAYLDTNGKVLTPFIFDNDGSVLTWPEEDEIARRIYLSDMILDTYYQVKKGNYSSVMKMQEAFEPHEADYLPRSISDSLATSLCHTFEKSPSSMNREKAEETFVEIASSCDDECKNLILDYFDQNALDAERKISLLQTLSDEYDYGNSSVLLGNMYYEGKEFKKDIPKAISYYHKTIYNNGDGKYAENAQKKLTEIWKQYGKTYNNLLGKLYTENDSLNVSAPNIILHKKSQTMIVDTLNQVKVPLGNYEVKWCHDDLFNIKDNTGCKIVTMGGKPIINDVFDEIYFPGNYKHREIVAKKNDMWGFYEADGTPITKHIFKLTPDEQYFTINGLSYNLYDIYEEGKMAVVRNGKIGCLDTEGKEVIPCIYDAFSWNELGASVTINGKKGIIDKNGKELIPCKYDEMENPENGLIFVRIDGKKGIIDKNGKELIPCKYDDIDFFEYETLLVTFDGKQGMIDKNGKELIPCKYEEIRCNIVDETMHVTLDGKKGLFDKNGKVLVPCIYDGFGDFYDNGKTIVSKDGKCGIIDNTGKLIIPCQYDSIWWDEDEGVFRYLNNVTVKF